MFLYVAVKKIFMAFIIAILIALLCFCVMYFSPGNPAEILLHYKNPTGGLNQHTVEMYAERLGTNRSFFTQFGNWTVSALKGDLGLSFKTGLPVIREFTDRMGCTFSLMIFATIVALITGVTFGVISALHHNGMTDRIIRFFAIINMSVPSFCLGFLFLWVFAINLRWVPSFGFDGFASLILPGTVLGIGYSSTIIRMTKSCIIGNLTSPYVITARAKGLKESGVLVKHVLKNISAPIITLTGMNMVSLLGGSVIIENIFGLPGLGNYLVTAIRVKDFPVIIGFVFLMGVIIILINLMVDLSYAFLDPRVRHAIDEK
jgi:peptide/nickel transport system permease protein